MKYYVYLFFILLFFVFAYTMNGLNQKFINTQKQFQNKEIKRIHIINPPVSDTENHFDIYKADDGHEYQLYVGYVRNNQWTHYVNCTLCKNKYDSLIVLIQNIKK